MFIVNRESCIVHRALCIVEYGIGMFGIAKKEKRKKKKGQDNGKH
jgi:hypothetical protein